MNKSRAVIVGLAKHDSTSYEVMPTKIAYGAWALPLPVDFDELVVRTINDLDPRIRDSVQTVLVASSHGDAHAKNRILDDEKTHKKTRGRPRDALGTTESTLMSLISKNCPQADDIFKVDAACASGLKALDVATVMVEHTDRLVLCFGIEMTATPYFAFGFGSLRATTEHPDRYFGPFDAKRNGFALGEGSAAIALCSQQTADRLKLPVIATVDAVSSFTNCPISPTQPSDQGKMFDWLDSCMGSYLQDGSLAYWDAHATATPLGDQAEYEVFRRFNLDVPISSFEGRIGHCVAASALIEITNAVTHLQQGIIPSNHGLTERFIADDRIITATQTTNRRRFIKCSFGFGGRNGATVITVQ